MHEDDATSRSTDAQPHQSPMVIGKVRASGGGRSGKLTTHKNMHSKGGYNAPGEWNKSKHAGWNSSPVGCNPLFNYRNGPHYLPQFPPPPPPPSAVGWPPFHLGPAVIPPPYPDESLVCPPNSNMMPPFPPPPFPPPPVPNQSMPLAPPFPPPPSPHMPSQGNYPAPYGAVTSQPSWKYYSAPPSASPASWNSGPPLPPPLPPPPPLPSSPASTVSRQSSRTGDKLEASTNAQKSSPCDKNLEFSNSELMKDSSPFNTCQGSRQEHYSGSNRRNDEFRLSSRESNNLRRPNVDRTDPVPERRRREDSRSRRWSPFPNRSRRTSERIGTSKSRESRSRGRSSSRDRSSASRNRDLQITEERSASKSSSAQRPAERIRRDHREARVKLPGKDSSVDGEHSSERNPDGDAAKDMSEEMTEWTRCSPADLFYQRSPVCPQLMIATPKLIALHDRFKSELLDRSGKIRGQKHVCEPVIKKTRIRSPKVSDSSGSESGEMSFGESSDDEEVAMRELERKKQHPDRLHEELWYNDPGEMNDGPLCRCSLKARRTGIRHGIYPGESHLEKCDPHTNNGDRLFHYRITMSPHTNFLTKFPTIIRHDDHEFIFEGFSMLSHYQIGALPTCKVIRFNIEYTIHFIDEKMPENFTICGIQIFSDYIFNEILELVDLDLRASGDETGCKRFHFFPRFARAIEENGKEILSMNVVQKYLLDSNKPLVEESDIPRLMKMNEYEWQDFTEKVKGMIVTYPGRKPSSLRVDQLDRDVDEEGNKFPDIVHFGIRPLQLSYAGNPSYQKAWREYVKYRHLLANKPKVSYQDRHKLMQKEMRLQEMRTKSNLKRDVTVVVSSKGFYRTGIMCDIVQHAMLLPVLVCHLRFHKSLDILEERIGHKFQDRFLLQLALTHPSYRENFGTNPDHARNALTNCGIRQPEYGDRRIHYANTRKRGINTLINIMSRFGKPQETVSNINHNERLEFLGDAVVEFLTSIHLFHLFPDIEEGGLATYRAAIVQNQHLAVLAKKLQLDHFMLYAHGSDLCHDLELRHAMANCFEALMGALFLDGEVEAADRVFCNTLFSDPDLLDVWVDYPSHPIQEQEPDGDRKWIASVPLLKKVMKFEEDIGVQFNHIRLLTRAFTHRSVGYNNLTLGSNQRLEFLGDTVLQLVASEYLYKFFPEHHEGHLSLLRSSLVNNRTQSVVCDDLGMVDYAIYAYPKGELKIKDRADLLEAFLGALYVDQGLEYCRVFCQVCFFPRLQHFIMNQDWNDPKSKLQQCCLTLRTMDGGEPDIPFYKVIESKGPTNTRIFTVAVYFRGKRLAKGSGHSIQQAEMAAANRALKSSSAELFPQLNHQRRVIERSLKQHQKRNAELQAMNAKEHIPDIPEVDDNRKMSWCV